MPQYCSYIHPTTNEKCKKRSSYGFKESNIRETCGKHSLLGMVDLNNSLCDECKTRASYGFSETNKKEKCGKHSKPGMIDLNNHLCTDCKKQATFGLENEKPSKCFEHKTEIMLDLKHKKCDECKERAYWGFPNAPKTKCSIHKLESMINDKHKECIVPGCTTKPIFGITQGFPTHCDLHKDLTMKDVVNKKCKVEGCSTRPTFNFKGLKEEYCTLHKLKTMVNVKDKLCEFENCIIRASFGLIVKKPTHCFLHKSHLMINVVSKSCEKCQVHQPVYGKPGFNASHCVSCREAGMIRRSKTKCKNKDCNQPAIYGSKGISNHCEVHKTSNDLNYVEKPCSKCELTMILDKDDLCEFCNPLIFEKVRLEKQNNLLNYLDKYITMKEYNFLISTDKTIDKGECGHERPDRVYELENKIIIVECDEHQHKSNPCECEQTRMINIGQFFGGKPVYFIRFNPDDYKSYNDEIMVDIKDRYKFITSFLKELLMKSKDETNNSLVSVIYLYFDGWKEEFEINNLWISLMNYEK